MRFFNTAGPVRADMHYLVPPLSRVDVAGLLELVRQQKYFVLHAPRQTGKTSALLALQDLLNGGTAGAFLCVYLNVEIAQPARENVGEAVRAILSQLAGRARRLGDDFPGNIWRQTLADAGPLNALTEVLGRWSEAASRPLVLLIDEVDALIGDTLVSVLRQLRSGYDQRPDGFPQCVALCGVRDVRDHRIRSGSEAQIIAGGSAFNIKAESLRLGDFSEAEVRALLGQHVEATGQEFRPEATRFLWEQTRGQPWLVNALAWEACFRSAPGRDRRRAITRDALVDAREALIQRRETHLDQLADKLQEDRVRRVVEPLLSGGDERSFSTRDLEYVRDLGLAAQDLPLRIANPIYAEVVPRQLTWAAQSGLAHEPQWYVGADGGLEVVDLLLAFQQFFREHSESWLERFGYREAGPQLLLQAFLQRIVNGGGRVEREYGLGRGRTDLLLIWPRGKRQQRFVVECKVLHHGLERTVREGLQQTTRYMDRCGAEAGHLIVFDRNATRPWDRKIFRRDETANGHSITVWGM